MTKIIGWIVLINVTLGSAVTHGEEKIVRLEFARYRRSEPGNLDRKAFQAMMPAIGKDTLEKLGLERVEEESLELKVSVGETFYAKNRIANKTITVRGKLVPKSHSSGFELTIRVVNQTHTGDFIPSPDGKREEITNQFCVDSITTIENERTIALGGLTGVNVMKDENNTRTELNYQVMNATLEDVPAAE